MSDDVDVVGQKAYDALIQGFKSGQWERFFEFFGPEVDALLPSPATGRFTGAEGRTKLVEFFSQFTLGVARFDEIEIIGKTVGADRVVFEDRSKGVILGDPYEALHCIHIIVRDGRVVGFHEFNRPV
jgi:hypothetical protein